MGTRIIHQIASDVRKDWAKVNYAAEPYLEAMESLDQITDNYYLDSGKSMVLYFLANAQSWKGEVARTIKAELKQIAGVAKK
jgi:hypothetical protein